MFANKLYTIVFLVVILLLSVGAILQFNKPTNDEKVKEKVVQELDIESKEIFNSLHKSLENIREENISFKNSNGLILDGEYHFENKIAHNYYAFFNNVQYEGYIEDDNIYLKKMLDKEYDKYENTVGIADFSDLTMFKTQTDEFKINDLIVLNANHSLQMIDEFKAIINVLKSDTDASYEVQDLNGLLTITFKDDNLNTYSITYNTLYEVKKLSFKNMTNNYLEMEFIK